MDSGVKTFHPIFDSESEISEKLSKASGLLPRNRACKDKKSKTKASTSSTCPKSAPSPDIKINPVLLSMKTKKKKLRSNISVQFLQQPLPFRSVKIFHRPSLIR